MTLLKKLQWSIGLLLFFFVLPVIAGQLPFNKQASTPIKQPEDKQVVFAATNLEDERADARIDVRADVRADKRAGSI